MPFSNSPTSRRRWIQLGMLAAASGIAVTQVGCLSMAAQVMHAAGMDLVPAQYEGLEKSTVAIVTVTDNSQYTNDPAARTLSRRVGEELTVNVKDIKLVREDLIEQYRDVHGYDSVDYREVGKEVGADKVLVIELTDLTLRDGMTLYRGRADVFLQVVDVATGNTVFKNSIDQYTFPKSTGQHSSETTEDRFRKLYLRVLAGEIVRMFYAYDSTELIAMDSMIASQ
ncbi:hypothetical protein N9N28_17535 [Rubripirellula amarantea]|uniref:Uncharacterized protein n=1 Tax=Rubripirellula amarantea TaxID=2527999 RepID=A0A5C5WUY2_9BACT|nr:hypothetical protein [Rubripirellula amarantea]MDA8746429.1 hypothetical protein [Rubripirellula amarantea]TWT54456.1 hypothetical protein Pla22_21030 [Rubripirellula amarantea]